MPTPRGAAPRFSPQRSFLYAAVIVLGFFGLAEGVLRVVGVGSAPPVRPRLLLREMDTDITLPFIREDRDVFWSPRPGFRGEFRGRPVTVNALGLRGPELERPKPAGRRRLACFGDSITFGFGAGDEETYSHHLGLLLADRGVEVVNAGVTGYTSHQVRGLLQRLAPLLELDVATFCIGWNDQNRRPITDRDYERRYRAARSTEGTLDRISLYRAMRRLYQRAVLRRLPDRRDRQRVPLADYRENMTEIVEICRRHGIRPVFIALPRRKRADEPRARSEHAEAVLQLGRELGVPVLETGELGLMTPLESNERYFIDLLHLSPAGAERMAQELARQLVELGLVPAATSSSGGRSAGSAP